MTGLRIVIATLLALSVAACGGDSVSPSQYAAESGRATCERFVRCGAFGSVEACIELFGFDRNSPAALEVAIKNGSVKYDGENAAECLDAARNASCNPGDKSARVLPSACDGDIRGTRREGDACFQDVQCASGRCDSPDDCMMACCEGTCAPAAPPPAKVGQACGNGTACVADAYCDGALCQPLKAAGTVCSSSPGHNECAFGLVCDGHPTTCHVPPNEGESDVTTPCSRIGQFYDSSGTCKKMLAEGESCNPELLLQCRLDLRCGGGGKCEPLPGAGQPCNIQAIPIPILPPCSSDNYCAPSAEDPSKGTCQARKPDGAACAREDECASDFCGGGTCAVAPVCA